MLGLQSEKAQKVLQTDGVSGLLRHPRSQQQAPHL